MFKTKVIITSKASALEKARQGVSMFRSAIKTLMDSNTQAQEIMKTNDETISHLADENDELSLLVTDNDKIVNNIQGLLGE